MLQRPVPPPLAAVDEPEVGAAEEAAQGVFRGGIDRVPVAVIEKVLVDGRCRVSG